MALQPTQADLESYLDEALPVEAMAEIERLLRSNPQLGEQLAAINGRRDAGVHTVGEIWRRHRLSCPSREVLGNYLLSVLETDEAEHIRFHLEVSGCRVCQANLLDLKCRQADAPAADTRRKKYFQSSAGQLPRR